ncbi:MAG: glycoside hydrolase family 140 protein [Prevotella sp.]|nr:glycoside hydrolase family 140 protein [Prevotella sp.]
MRTIYITLLLLFLLSVPACAGSESWQLCVSSNSRFLQYPDGKPFFWLGDTGWLLPQKLDREATKGYLSRCQQNGYNVVQVQVLNAVPSVNAYGALSNDPQNPWDFSAFTTAATSTGAASSPSGGVRDGLSYWDHMDFIVKTAEAHDIYIAMVCIWGGLVKGGALDVEGAKAYGRFLAERYKDSPNIIWVIGGDIQGDVKPEVWTALAETIKSIDTQHLMTFHPRGRYTSAHWWSKAPWIDFHMYQSGHRRYGQRMSDKTYPIPDNTEEDCWMYVDSTWKYNPVKPVIDGEPSYEDIPQGLHFPTGPRWRSHDVRRYAYWDVFAGTCGHTYGHNAIMQMARPGDAVAYSDTSKPWYEAQRDSGYVQMKYLKALMLSLPYFERVPCQDIIYRDNGKKYDRLIATRGKDYALVYNYTGRDMPVDMTLISGKRKNVWWMSCIDGSLTYIGAMSNGRHTIQPPVTSAVSQSYRGSDTSDAAAQLLGYEVRDGVLIIIDADKDYLSPDQPNIIRDAETKENTK